MLTSSIKFLITIVLSFSFILFAAFAFAETNATANNGNSATADPNKVSGYANDGEAPEGLANKQNASDHFLDLRAPLPGASSINTSRSQGSLGILEQYVNPLYRFLVALASVFAVMVLIYSGFKIMVAGGDSGSREDAKTMVIKTLVGVAFLFLTGLFLKLINPNFYFL